MILLASSGSTAAGIQQCEACSRSSFHTKTKLRLRLADRKLLIVLDDVWEMKVIKEVLVNAKGLKYLVTSQIRDVWNAAEKIELKRPSKTQAIQILANYTKGISYQRKLPAKFQVDYNNHDCLHTLRRG